MSLVASPSRSVPLVWPALDDRAEAVLKNLQSEVQHHPYWCSRLSDILNGRQNAPSIHLGVFVEPFLTSLLEGKKTVESRFSANRQAPFRVAQENDILLIKQSGGPITGICRITNAWFYTLDESSWEEIKSYAPLLCVQDPLFWQTKASASYASLLTIDQVSAVSPVAFAKRDRRGWMLLHKECDA